MSSPSNQFFTVDCGPESEVNFINQRGGKQINKQKKKKHYKIHRKRWRRLSSILQAGRKRSLSLDYYIVAAFCSKEKLMNRSTLSYARKHETYLVSWSTLSVFQPFETGRAVHWVEGVFSPLRMEECFGAAASTDLRPKSGNMNLWRAKQLEPRMELKSLAYPLQKRF